MLGSIELKRREHEMAALRHSEQWDALHAATSDLMGKAIMEIALGHHDPRGLCEAVMVVIVRASKAGER